MSIQKVMLVGVLCLLVCVCVGLVAQPVYAQDDIKGSDKKLGAKQGMSVLKDTKSNKDKPSASYVQMAVGIGSIFVTVALVKWL